LVIITLDPELQLEKMLSETL